MKEEVMLIRARGRDDGFHSVPWGIVSLASYLQKFGYRATIADRKENSYSLKKIMREIRKRKISYVGISAMTSQVKDAEFLCGYFRKNNQKVILGGLHYTIYPQDGLKIADYVFRGQSENSLLDFLNNGPKMQIYDPNPVFDLDDIPLPNQDLLRSLHIHKNSFTIVTSRECAFHCTCCLDRKYRLNKVMMHSAGYVVDLMEIMQKSCSVNNFFIGDDVFTLHKNRALEFCREIKKRGLRVKLGGFTHVGIDDLELYKAMKDAGFESISLGIESGSDEVLKAMNKRQTVAQARITIEWIKKAGLNIMVTFMVGNILETEQSLKQTLALAKELRLNGWVSYAQPFPGTKFYEVCAQYGTLGNNDPTTYWNDKITFIPQGLSRSKLKYYHCKISKVLKSTILLRTKIINKLISLWQLLIEA